MPVPWKTAIGKAVTSSERECLRSLASLVTVSFKRPVIVNIGIFRCATMYCLRAGAPSARLVGVDIKPCPVSIHRDLKAEFIIADSRVCHADFKDPVHLLFIDGDHHYAVVKEDIKNWIPKVVPGGIIVFHDYAPLPKDLRKNSFLEGVKRAVDEWWPVGWIRLQAPDSIAVFQRPK